MGNKTGDLVFRLVFMAVVTSGVGCSDDVDADNMRQDTSSETDGTDSATADSATTSEVDSDTQSDTGTDTSGDSDSDSDTGRLECPPYTMLSSMTIGEEPGLPANLDDVCNSAAAVATASSQAVQLTVDVDTDSTIASSGVLQFPAALAPYIDGTPVITVDAAYPQEFENITVGNVAATTDGFTFEIDAPELGALSDYIPTVESFRSPYIHFKVAFNVNCGSVGINGARPVEAIFPLQLCGTTAADGAWLGPNEVCNTCGPIISEVSAIPVPTKTNKEGVLCGPMQASILPIGESETTILLVADADGDVSDTTYFWRADAGTLIHQQGPLAIYEKPNTAAAQLIQVAAMDSSRVAVATYLTKKS